MLSTHLSEWLGRRHSGLLTMCLLMLTLGCNEDQAIESSFGNTILIDVQGLPNGSYYRVRAERQKGAALTVSRRGKMGEQPLSLICPDGVYHVSLTYDEDTFYFGGGTSRPFPEQADPVVVSVDLPAPQVVFEFGMLDLDLQVEDPRAGARFLGISGHITATDVSRTVVSFSHRYQPPVSGSIATQSYILAPGTYAVDLTLPESRSAAGHLWLGDERVGEIEIRSNERTSYILREGPPTLLQFQMDAPDYDDQRSFVINLIETGQDEDPFGLVMEVPLDPTTREVDFFVWPREPFQIFTRVRGDDDSYYFNHRWFDAYERENSRVFDLVPGDTLEARYESAEIFMVTRSADPIDVDFSMLVRLHRLGTNESIDLGQGVGPEPDSRRIRNLIPGDYRLLALPGTAPAGSPFPWQYYPDATTNEEDSPVWTLGTDTPVNVEWAFQVGGGITGRATEVGGPVTSGTVFLMRADLEEPTGHEGQVEETGHFEIIGVRNGDYRLGIRRAGQPDFYHPGVDTWQAAGTVEVRGLSTTSAVNIIFPL